MSHFRFLVPAKPSTLKSSSSSSLSKSQAKISALELKSSSTAASSSPSKPLDLKLSHVLCPESNKIIAPSNLTAAQQQAIDITILREKSKNLDLPLISALCNDRSLLKQTKAFVMPKHPRSNPQISASLSSKAKYPVSGLSSTQLSKTRKTNVSHRHPNDKLPPLPVQSEGGNKNNYVMDPIPLKQKTNQNTNL